MTWDVSPPPHGSHAGDQIKIVASAKVIVDSADGKTDSAKSTTNARDGEKSKDENDKRKRVLRLALTEESIGYVGGNKLRFHHHVVRALPGGVQGTDLKDGAGKIEVALNLADLRHDLESYLSDFTKTSKFPTALPEIKLDNLAVVACVQDDGDRSILHAVSVPVETAGP